MQIAGSNSKKAIVLGLVILVFILSAVLLYVQYNVFRDLNAEVEEEEIALLAAQTRLTRLIEHRNNAAEYESRLAYAKSMIPDRPAEEDILRSIQRLAEDNNLRVVEIRFDGRNDMEDYTAMPLSIILEGSFQDIRQLLKQLYGGDRAVRVDNLSLNRVGEAGSSLRVAISANTFYNQN